MKKFLFCCMILFVFIVGCERATSPGVNSKIQGTVLNPSGNPVADAKISVNFNIDCDYPIRNKKGLLKFKHTFTDSDSINDPPQVETNLWDNFPNPFTSTTTITFSLGSSCLVFLYAQYLHADEIISLINDSLPAQIQYSFCWDGENNDNKNIQNGLYKIFLTAEDEVFCD